ncbi:MAG: PD40 domain-containing protein [Gemmatimonadetes bacterium]|nr:PD40 domain-containing protein [Gemmatimonadota bacterium]
MNLTRTLVVASIGALAIAAAARPAPAPASLPVPPDSGEVHLAGIRQLTFEGQNAEAYFSPDGAKLIYQATVDSARCDQQYVMSVDGSENRRVSNGEGKTTCGYFYDRGRRIFYASTHLASRECPPPPDYSQGYVWKLEDFDIFTARVDGSDVRRITRTPGYDAEGTLSPDGRTIVFTSEQGGDLDVYTMRTDGSEVRRLTTELGYDGGPFFSHDGRLIVYRAFHPGPPEEQAEYRSLLARHLVRPTRMELWVMNADGTNRHRVTSLGGANFAPYFTPDDRRIIFASNQADPHGRNFDLYLVNLDGTGLERVTTYPDFDSFPMFSPDGRKLVWASNRNGRVRGETNIFIADWVP